MRKRIGELAVRWVKGYETHTQFHADSEALIEYDRLCETMGPNSREARQLKPLIDAIHARRGGYELPPRPKQPVTVTTPPTPRVAASDSSPFIEDTSNGLQPEPAFDVLETAPIVRAEPQPDLNDDIIVLTVFTDADVPEIVEADNEPEHAYRFGWLPGASTSTNASRYVLDSSLRWHAGQRAAFAVRDRSKHSLLGGVELNFESGDGRAKLSYWTYAQARRKGVATRAAKLICRFGFEKLSLARIQIMCEADNIGSMGVAANSGFHLEGVLRDYGVRNGRRHNMLLYSLLPADLTE